MRLWILERTGPKGYDEMIGMVVAAESVESARKVASQNCGGEGPNAWFRDDTKCDELHAGHNERLVIGNFNAG